MTKYIFYIAVIIVLIATSCEDVIDVKLKDADVDLFAVEAKITTMNEPFVFLYKGQQVDVDEPYVGVSNATVTIMDDAQPVNAITLVEAPDTRGYYVVPDGESYLGIAGRTYTLTIESEGATMISSEKLAPVEPIDSIQVRASLRGDRRFLGVFTFGRETPGIGDYYKWDIYINDTLLNDTEFLAFASDELVDGNYVNGLEIFTDFHDPNEKSERKVKFMDTVVVKQLSISEFGYKYYYQMFNQGTTGGLFSIPPANIKSNFTSSDGKPVLGLFTAHDVSVSNAVVIDESIENELDERP